MASGLPGSLPRPLIVPLTLPLGADSPNTHWGRGGLSTPPVAWWLTPSEAPASFVADGGVPGFNSRREDLLSIRTADSMTPCIHKRLSETPLCACMWMLLDFAELNVY